MSKAFDFIKECGIFYVGTVNGTRPAVRPFGAIMEYDGRMYICTANTKEVYKQLLANPCVQLSATKGRSYEWIRLNADAVEDKELAAKKAMIDACPALVNIFGSAENPVFAVFALEKVSGFIANGPQIERF